MSPDIATTHMNSKGEFYWSDLTSGSTGQYKEAVMETLVRHHFPGPARNLIDIGCGTCETVLKYKRLLGGENVVCTDYDPAIVEQMRQLHVADGIDWRVADIFDLTDLPDTYDLVFLMDMIHEVYSFYGRPNRNLDEPIDHALGIDTVHRAFEQVTSIVAPKGGIILTDNVLSEETGRVVVRLKHPAVQSAVRFLFENYRTRRFDYSFREDDLLEINARDLCVVLTQYNKIKAESWNRWNIERLETHQYMTRSEYDAMFDRFGFDLHAVVGTPEETRKEWESDFEMIDGLPSLPEKRITLLAIKR